MERLAAELKRGPTPDREAKIMATIERIFGAVHGWSPERIRRMGVVGIVAHAAEELRDVAETAKAIGRPTMQVDVVWIFQQGAAEFVKQMPPAEVIEAAVAAWARAGRTRASAKAPLQWPALAALCASAGLGNVKHETLRTDWAKWTRTRDV
ncbi:MAG TPA: hypothetical protein PKD61_04455 [Polyangiaceae bacterium]|nr:hypothetical protein [Polyangiaceae bacterium]